MEVTEMSERISQKKFLHTYQVILEMVEKGENITFYSVSERANVSRPFLYRHKELKDLILDNRITHMTKQELQKEVLRLRLKVAELEALLQSW